MRFFNINTLAFAVTSVIFGFGTQASADYVPGSSDTLVQQAANLLQGANEGDFSNRSAQIGAPAILRSATRDAQSGDTVKAEEKLGSVLTRMSGCSSGSPGSNDFVTNCSLQTSVSSLLSDALGGAAANADSDNDGILDGVDNCPTISNSGQADSDNDGIGDSCDLDKDGDGVANGSDNCPVDYNPDQSDLNNNYIGDVCDPDGTVIVKIWYDANTNGVWDFGEGTIDPSHFSDIYIYVENSPDYTGVPGVNDPFQLNPDGTVAFAVPHGGPYTVTFIEEVDPSTNPYDITIDRHETSNPIDNDFYAGEVILSKDFSVGATPVVLKIGYSTDIDKDGISSSVDNCRYVANPNQLASEACPYYIPPRYLQ